MKNCLGTGEVATFDSIAAIVDQLQHLSALTGGLRTRRNPTDRSQKSD
jgi:hypothetical protein